MDVSLNFRQAYYGSETARFPIMLVTIDHDDLDEPIYLSSDPTARLAEYTTDEQVVYGTVSRGQTYLFFPMRLKLPSDLDDGPGELTFELDNVHRTYVETIRTIMSPPRFKVEIVLDNALDTVEAQWPELLLANVKYNPTVITGTLRLEDLMAEPYPAGTMTPGQFPGLF